MLKTRLPEAELAPTRCFISSNARWKRAQPPLALLRHHFAVCEPRSEGQAQLLLLPTGLAEEVRAVPAVLWCRGIRTAVLVHPSLCSPPRAAPVPRRGSCPAVQPHSVSVTSLPDQLQTVALIAVPVLLHRVKVPPASYRNTESFTKVGKDS